MNEFAIDQLSQQIEQARARLSAGAADLPEAVIPLWRQVQKEIAGAVAACEPVKAKVRALWGRREYTVAAREQQAHTLVVELNDAVNARLEKADKTLGEIAYRLQSGISPSRPEGATQLEVIDRKEDLRRLLERAPTVDMVTQLMAEALTNHDELTAFCLTPDGPLSWTYKLLGIDRQRLRSALYRAIRQTRLEPVPGEGLLRLYEATHEDPTSWTQLKTAILGLVGCVGEGSAGLYRQHALFSMGQGSTPRGDAETSAQGQRATDAVVQQRAQVLKLQDQAAAASSGGDLSGLLEASKVQP